MEENGVVYVFNPSKSGLCDRLIDLMLLSAYAKVLNAKVYMNWESNLNKPVSNIWTEDRNNDYVYSNFSQYFNLPDNVVLNVMPKKIDHMFNDYLGGSNSPHLFHNKYLTNKISVEDFIEIYFNTIKQFTPTEKLLNLVKNYPKPKLGVHLRRTDKIDNPHSCGVDSYELIKLNIDTCGVVDKFLKYGKCVYISSDSETEYNNYVNRYKDNCINENIILEKSIEKTYIDIYMLSLCDYVIMSQYHTNFSVFAAMINRNKIIYFYDDAMIKHGQYILLDNFIYYKNFID